MYDVLDFGSLTHQDVAASPRPTVAAEATYHSKDVAASWASRLLCEPLQRPQVFAVLRDGSTFQCFVMHQGLERTVVYVAMDAVAGARRTSGRHKTGGVPPKPPATISLSLLPSVFWDFGSFYLKALRLLRQRKYRCSDRFCPIGARCLLHVAASLVPTVAATANSAIPTLRRHSVSSVAGQFQVSLWIVWKNSVEWCTPWEIFRNSQGKVGIGQEAVSVCRRTRKLLDWAGELQVGFLADPAAQS